MKQWQRSLAVGAVALAVGLGTSGCYRSSWKSELKPLRAESEERAHFFLYGLVPTREYNADEFCPQGQVAEVGIKMTVGNWFAQGFTFGLWTPRFVTFKCGAPVKAAVESTDGTVVASTPTVEGGVQ